MNNLDPKIELVKYRMQFMLDYAINHGDAKAAVEAWNIVWSDVEEDLKAAKKAATSNIVPAMGNTIPFKN